MFFVISGYVVGRSLYQELTSSESFSFSRFYQSRIRRLLPTLGVVASITVLCSVLVLHPGETQNQAAMTGFSTSLFSSNFLLWRLGGGYFDPSSQLNPLLHTWSLSLEEQFYCVFPVCLYLLFQSARRFKMLREKTFLVTVVGLVVLSSFVFCSTLNGELFGPTNVIGRQDKFLFYLLPTRIWEFGIGFIIVLLNANVRTKLINSSIFCIGILLVLWPALTFDDFTRFPGLNASFPVFGTALLIISGSQVLFFPNVFNSRILMWFGDISYSWYLVHWPIFVFGALLLGESANVRFALVLFSLAPTILVYQNVEKRFRYPKADKAKRNIFSFAAIWILLPLIASGILLFYSSHPVGLNAPSGWTDMRLASRTGCVDIGGVEWPADTCTFGPVDAEKSLFLVGDSFANSASDGVVSASIEAGWKSMVWARSGCPFLIDHPTYGVEDCRGYQEAALKVILEVRPNLVVIANRSTGYTYPEVPNDIFWATIETSSGEKAKNRSEALGSWEDGFRKVVEKLRNAEIEILVIETVPEFPIDFIERLSLLRRSPTAPIISTDFVERRRQEVLAIEKAIGSQNEVNFFDPVSVLCESDSCSATRDGEWLYMDAEHMNPTGSSLMTPDLIKFLKEIAGT